MRNIGGAVSVSAIECIFVRGHLLCMADQVSENETLGWIVTVARAQTAEGEPSLSVYFAAISDQVDAIQAVKKASAAREDTQVIAHQEISKSLMAALSLKPGDAMVW
jgi:hypothetical protein